MPAFWMQDSVKGNRNQKRLLFLAALPKGGSAYFFIDTGLGSIQIAAEISQHTAVSPQKVFPGFMFTWQLLCFLKQAGGFL